ncbi:unnamed protein product [Clonostachys chloroleuca]|uniref:Protein kinase domain-containing protein n=1 Tax=Clonostachys chloroleuca TaxID=1926264 RepID=A0AA35QFU2_9HYPO|nr:unnamed protein product [Clonostachys chloroleuca]
MVDQAQPTTPTASASTDQKPQLVKSLQDLTIIEHYDRGATKPKATTFFHITADEELYFGETPKSKFDTTIAEFNEALERVPDEDVWPEIPPGTQLTLAPEGLTEESAFLKRPEIISFHPGGSNNDMIPRSILRETLIMEQISTSPHPVFIRYLGCRVRRNRITAIWLERHEITLKDYVETPGFTNLDKDKFVDSIDSAVYHLHSLGLAHNDINPSNIMVKDDMLPVLIDFGSCQPFGYNLDSLGTVGWYEKPFFTSEKEHDIYGLKKLREWIKNPE